MTTPNQENIILSQLIVEEPVGEEPVREETVRDPFVKEPTLFMRGPSQPTYEFKPTVPAVAAPHLNNSIDRVLAAGSQPADAILAVGKHIERSSRYIGQDDRHLLRELKAETAEPGEHYVLLGCPPIEYVGVATIRSIRLHRLRQGDYHDAASYGLVRPNNNPLETVDTMDFFLTKQQRPNRTIQDDVESASRQLHRKLREAGHAGKIAVALVNPKQLPNDFNILRNGLLNSGFAQDATTYYGIAVPRDARKEWEDEPANSRQSVLDLGKAATTGAMRAIRNMQQFPEAIPGDTTESVGILRTAFVRVV